MTSPKRILVIDDEELVLKSVTKLLEKEGYEVAACRSGKEALEKTKKEAFDLIVCDVRMPKLNGIETLKKIREQVALKKGKRKSTRLNSSHSSISYAVFCLKKQ